MALIGMPEAGRRAGISSASVKRALDAAGVKLQQINERAWAVEEKDLARFIAQRQAAGYTGRGRPPGTFKPSSPRSKAHKLAGATSAPANGAGQR